MTIFLTNTHVYNIISGVYEWFASSYLDQFISSNDGVIKHILSNGTHRCVEFISTLNAHDTTTNKHSNLSHECHKLKQQSVTRVSQTNTAICHTSVTNKHSNLSHECRKQTQQSVTRVSQTNNTSVTNKQQFITQVSQTDTAICDMSVAN